jgi:hypothetical protein
VKQENDMLEEKKALDKLKIELAIPQADITMAGQAARVLLRQRNSPFPDERTVSIENPNPKS